MILREPYPGDWRFICECYEDWPISDFGPMTPDRAMWMINRATKRTNAERLLVGQEDVPVGLIYYGDHLCPFNLIAEVYEMVVHPDKRGQGLGSKMYNAFYDRMVADGVVAFKTALLPDTVLHQKADRNWQTVGEHTGEHTGIPLRDVVIEAREVMERRHGHS